ncbi:auxin response factor 2A [Cannabis sativa]|uniref:auxin response factor 2A n=1 Tax=Cannabis sativa TaxID=3483 RepID=UPI0029CA6148|nr:auxin response factor 2A [Cannabis sativa]XP_060961419.1 auxin response factor 2A [Cannabis sativa]
MDHSGVEGTNGLQEQSTSCFEVPTENEDVKDPLSNGLWKACAGRQVRVPLRGEMVYYFPQGHIEQVQAYASEDGNVEMPIYNLPSKILCKVSNIELKAEVLSDEVFAQITLLPLTDKLELSSNDVDITALPKKTKVFSFSKILTPSDTSTHGGFSVPKRQADGCFPLLDMSQQPPVQELVAKDLHGFEWHFRHIYRGQPKRHLLTSGWSTFVSAKKLVAGDSCIFLRGENGDLRVGIRRAMKRTLNHASTSVISSQSMQHGVLATAFHSFSALAFIHVYYRPWTCPAEFIIPYDEYMKSVENDYLPGTKFGYTLEGEECSEKRYTGTIIGVEDQDGIRWPGSHWRCLKVQWDAQSSISVLPERLSPWNIKPVDSTDKTDIFVRPPPKRRRELDLLSSESHSLATQAKHTPQRLKEVLQGQEISVRHGQEPSARIQSMLPKFVMPPNPELKQGQLKFEKQLQAPFYQYPREQLAFPGEKTTKTSLTNNQWWSMCAPYRGSDSAAFTKSFSVSNGNSGHSGSQEYMTLGKKSGDGAPCYPNDSNKYMLFGVNLFNSHQELPSPQVTTSCELLSPFSFPPTSQCSSVSEPIQVSDTSKSVSDFFPEKQCNKCCSIRYRSYIKVLKHGTALGRTTDLSKFDGYAELIAELDQMFGFNGSLIDGSSEWKVTYMDIEGDLMLLGDYDWQVFRSAARKIFICPMEEINKMNPSSLKSSLLVD